MKTRKEINNFYDALEIHNKMKTETTFSKVAIKVNTGINTGDFVFRCINNIGEEKDLRIGCAEFEAINSPTERVLCFHALHGVFTAGKPFEILSRRWEASTK